MLWRRDWFSRSKFSFLWNTIYSIYLRITNSPSVIYRVEEEEGGTTNEKHHMIDIHWIYITEPPLPSRSGCSSDYVQPTVQTLPLKVLTLHFYLFHRNLKTCSESVLFRQDLTVHPSTVWACAVQFIKKKRSLFYMFLKCSPPVHNTKIN